MTHKLRLLVVLDTLQVSGLSRVATTMASGLAARGHSVILMTGANGPLADQLESAIDVLIYPALARSGVKSIAASAVSIARLTSSWRPEVVHVHQRRHALACLVGRLPQRALLVEHVHSEFTDRRFTSFRSPVIVAVGRSTAGALVSRYRPSGEVLVLRNGVADAGPLAPLPPEPRLIAVGRVEAQKRPDEFVGLLRALRLRGVSVTGVWVGDGPLLSVARGAWHDVAWPGSVADVARVLDESSVIVSTSVREGLPLAILEAKARGRAVFARAVGSIAEAVSADSGYVWNGRAATKDVDAMAAILASRDRLAGMGRCARVEYERAFTADIMVESLEQMLVQRFARWKARD